MNFTQNNVNGKNEMKVDQSTFSVSQNVGSDSDNKGSKKIWFILGSIVVGIATVVGTVYGVMQYYK